MSTKKIQEKIVENLKKWQQVEDGSIAAASNVIKGTENAIVKLVMEIIQRDSQFHRTVQGFIIDSLESKTITLTPDELAEVWDLIEKHIRLEKETIEIATGILNDLKGKKMLVQEYLIKYLLIDEQKHNTVLENLEKIKAGMYPYA